MAGALRFLGGFESRPVLLLVLGPAKPRGTYKTQDSRRDGKDRH